MSDAIQQIQRDAEQARREAQSSASSAREALRGSAAKASTETKETARKGRVSSYRAYQPNIEAIRQTIEQEQRRRYLPGYPSTLTPALRSEREGLRTERELGRTASRQAEAKALADIQEQLEQGEAEIESSLKTSLRDIDRYEGEAIAAEREYEAALAEAQPETATPVVEAEPLVLSEFKSAGGYDLVSALDEGVPEDTLADYFSPEDIATSKQQLATKREFESENIEVNPNEWINRSEWDKLDADTQRDIKFYGIEKYNERIDAQQAALDRLNPYRQYKYIDGELTPTWDLVKAVRDGRTSTELQAAGFNIKEVTEAQYASKKQQEYEVETAELQAIEAKLKPFEKQAQAKLFNAIPLPNAIVPEGYRPNEYYYDIGTAQVKGAVTADELEKLGYSKDDIKRAKVYAEVGYKQYIPIYGTVATWGVMTPPEKVLAVSTEALTFLPMVGWLGKAGKAGMAATEAEVRSLQAAARVAQAEGRFAQATEYMARAARLVNPSPIARAATITKSALYGLETTVTSPFSLAKGLVRQPRATLSGIWDVTKFPIVHPLETGKGLRAVMAGRVGLGEPMLLMASRYLSPSRAYPAITVSEYTNTGVIRAPGYSPSESVIGAQRTMSEFMKSPTGKSLLITEPSGLQFKVRVPTYQRVFGGRLFHATPTSDIFRGMQLRIAPEGEGLFTSPVLSQEWTIASASGATGVSKGGIAFPASDYMTYYRVPRNLPVREWIKPPSVAKVGKWTAPMRYWGAPGAELEAILTPRSIISVGNKPEIMTRLYGQMIKIYPARVGKGVVELPKAPITARYRVKARGILESFANAFKGGKPAGVSVYDAAYEMGGEAGEAYVAKMSKIAPPEQGISLAGYKGYRLERLTPALSTSIMPRLPVSQSRVVSMTQDYVNMATRETIARMSNIARPEMVMPSRTELSVPRREIIPSERTITPRPIRATDIMPRGITPQRTTEMPIREMILRNIPPELRARLTRETSRTPETPQSSYSRILRRLRGFPELPPPREPEIPRAQRMGYEYRRPPEKPIIPPSGGSSEGEHKRAIYPPGTITWRQGMFWRAIPPPYTQEKPDTLKYPPQGVTKFAKGEGSAYKTAQVIGGREAVKDYLVDVDMGVVDVFTEGARDRIRFSGGGLRTNVGKRMPSKVKGMTVRTTPIMKRVVMV